MREILVACLACVLGCAQPPESSCVKPLADWCDVADCSDFDAALDAAKSATIPRNSPECFQGNCYSYLVWQCGLVNVLEVGDWSSRSTGYYDIAAGALIGVDVYSDVSEPTDCASGAPGRWRAMGAQALVDTCVAPVCYHAESGEPACSEDP